ncbi:MAG: hypothetical protein KGZ30_04670 [Anaplasmataceae bacterium]|nr:hypothetical protein [Anaplasmataceae bacterium]
MEHDDLYAFAFRGLLAEEALDKAGRKPKSNFSKDWEEATARRLGILLLDESLVIKSRKMAVIYTAICAFENSVREFVEKKLLEEKGENWWSLCVKVDIRNRAENRKKSEKDVRWLTPRGNSLIYYTEFGDLISIMGKPENWKYFEVHIGNLEWAKQIITTLEKSRNIIMHSGELAPTDIERIGMFIRDWVAQVG